MERTVACLLVLLLAPSVVRAQGVGFVGGGTVDPEQFYVGTFFETPAIAGSVHVRPGIDGSWGEDLRIASINLDVIRRSGGPGWQFYTGGGPTILIARPDSSSDVTDPDRDVSAGLSAVFGFDHAGGFLAEFKFGHARNGPSLKFAAGFRIGERR